MDKSGFTHGGTVATGWKVAGLIPNEVTTFGLHLILPAGLCTWGALSPLDKYQETSLG
jgi:hypothetical protein